ncbi:LysE family translocator [Caulobacter sp. 17J65-9]|uniref:LysE family translocator n=1 Tax=Caulobacter sp. 17J65-9 TaxID=2709382 RepID=UPI0013C70CE2|nr:LysE family translocator [Caulobacter sp. 17J65-9]NEX91903.1 LysE family translocator [Caulobacter sp. 17J65-9]
MTVVQALLAFVAAATLLTITPGVDTAMVLRSAAGGGARPAAFAALGISIGCLVWGTLVSLGLGALLAASGVIYTIVKWVGAAYLVWLGVKLLWKPREGFDPALGAAGGASPWRSLRQGFLTNILNPKIGVFYITFLPQFVPAGADVAAFSMLLAVVHVLIGLLWFAVLIAATAPVGRLLRRPQVTRALDRVVGGVFLAFGARLALSR